MRAHSTVQYMYIRCTIRALNLNVTILMEFEVLNVCLGTSQQVPYIHRDNTSTPNMAMH